MGYLLGPNDDPGRKWRRIARVGAVACTLATVLPFEHTQSLWHAAREIVELALGQVEGRRNGPEFLFIVAFCCLALPVFLGGPVYLLVCSAASIHTSYWRVMNRFLILALWAGTALTPYIAVFRNLPERNRATETPLAIAISLLSLYLLVCGMSYLASRKVRDTSLYIFSIGTIPAALLLLAWVCLGSVLIFKPGADLTIVIDIFLGLSGSLALLVGWLKWWGAVKDKCAVEAAIAKDRETAVSQEKLHA